MAATNDVSTQPIPRLAAAGLLALFGIALVGYMLARDGGVTGDGPRDPVAVGEAWLDAIIDDDQEAFDDLHHQDLAVNDTLMGYSRASGILTDTRIAELYPMSLSALHASLETDGDYIQSDGCAPAAGGVRCGYSGSLVGSDEHLFVMRADLQVRDGRISRITFTPSTEPADLRAEAEAFFAGSATDEDRACITLGFNTPGCGRHETDFLQRYLDFFNARQP